MITIKAIVVSLLYEVLLYVSAVNVKSTGHE